MQQSFLIVNNELEKYIISTNNLDIYYLKLRDLKKFLSMDDYDFLNLNNDDLLQVKHNVEENKFYFGNKKIVKNTPQLKEELKQIKPLNKKSHKLIIDKNHYTLNCYNLNNDEIKICTTTKSNQYTSICKYLSFNITNLTEFREISLFKKINNIINLDKSDTILFKDLFNISTTENKNIFFPNNETLSNFMKELIRNTKNDNELDQIITKTNNKYNLFISKNEDPIKLTNQKIKNYFHLIKSNHDPIIMKNELSKLAKHEQLENVIQIEETKSIKRKIGLNDFGR